jgi:hypothetical protein
VLTSLVSRSLVLVLAVVAACGGDDSMSNNGGVDSGSGNGSDSGNGSCTRQPGVPAAADRTRYVVVAHPYTSDGSPSPMFEVLSVTSDGTLSRFEPARTFSLGDRMPFGVISFTPDGEIGIAPLDNGNLGVFRIDADGMPTVVDPDFDGAFYADRVVMDPSGERAYVIDRNTRDNGGGIYSVTIACDGTLTDGDLVAAANAPGGFGLAGTSAVLAARDVLDSPTTGDDVHLLDWSSATPTVTGGGDAFGDDTQVFSGFALSHDGGTGFIGDSNVVGTNRIAVVGVGTSDITPLKILDLTDPSSIVASPFGDVALVSSSQPPDEGLYVLDKQGPASTWQIAGELTYMGANPQLPGDAVMIAAGQLTGHVFVSELSNMRQVAFQNTGEVEDLGSLTFGDGLEEILGAIGITP